MEDDDPPDDPPYPIGDDQPFFRRPPPKRPPPRIPLDPFGQWRMGGFATVGGVSRGDRALFSIHHPMMESWSAQSVRPQFWLRGRSNDEHHQGADAARLYADEPTRPQVLAMRSWGAQNGTDWVYRTLPQDSRARGGTANGGMLFCPPEFEPEDYLGINVDMDTAAPTTTSWVAAAMGVGYALGEPHTDGGLAAGSVVFAREVGSTNKVVRIAQLGENRSESILFSGWVDPGGGTPEVIATIGTGGNQCVLIPRGTTAQQPATITPEGGIRINSSGAADVLEFYNAQADVWVKVAVMP